MAARYLVIQEKFSNFKQPGVRRQKDVSLFLPPSGKFNWTLQIIQLAVHRKDVS